MARMGWESVEDPAERKKEYDRKYEWNRYHSFEAEGRCVKCGGAPAEGKKLCAECERKNKESNRKLYEKRAMEGRCPKCGGAPEEGKKLCAECAEWNREYFKKISAERKMRGLCRQCGLPATEGSIFCEKHLALNRGRFKEKKLQWAKNGLCIYCGKPVEPKRDDTACQECRRKQKENRQRRKGENAKLIKIG